MKYTKRQNEKMIKHFMDNIQTNMAELKTCNDLDRFNTLIESNKLLLDNIKIIKTSGLGDYRFNMFRNEIDKWVK